MNTVDERVEARGWRVVTWYIEGEQAYQERELYVGDYGGALRAWRRECAVIRKGEPALCRTVRVATPGGHLEKVFTGRGLR